VTTLVVKALSLSYGNRRILSEVSLEVPSGSLVAILGPSGCGKTSLLMAIAGLLPLDSGSITVGSRDLSSATKNVPPEQRGIGWVPQEASLFPHLSVGDNIGFGMPRGRRRNERVDTLAKLIGLEGFADRSPGQLSGGQAQRVALARALAPSPDVLLLDEPFGALDSVLRHSLARDVARVLREEDTTAILVTHDREEALDLADFVAVMDQGRIVQVGTPVEIYESPATRGWRPSWGIPWSFPVCGAAILSIASSAEHKSFAGPEKTGPGAPGMWCVHWETWPRLPKERSLAMATLFGLSFAQNGWFPPPQEYPRKYRESPTPGMTRS